MTTTINKRISEASEETHLQAPRDEGNKNLGPFRSIPMGCITLGVHVAEVMCVARGKETNIQCSLCSDPLPGLFLFPCGPSPTSPKSLCFCVLSDPLFLALPRPFQKTSAAGRLQAVVSHHMGLGVEVRSSTRATSALTTEQPPQPTSNFLTVVRSDLTAKPG